MTTININNQNAVRKPNNNNEDLVNDAVRFPQVRLIGPQGEQLGIMTSREAQFKANSFEMDLLCVSATSNPPVCKIVNYGKYRFEQQKKAKEAKKNQHVTLTKEVQLTPQIGIHDMETKAKAANKWLLDGNRVKVGVRFRGRQLTHVEVGQETLDKFISLVAEASCIDKPALLEGKWLYCVLAPKKK